MDEGEIEALHAGIHLTVRWDKFVPFVSELLNSECYVSLLNLSRYLHGMDYKRM